MVSGLFADRVMRSGGLPVIVVLSPITAMGECGRLAMDRVIRWLVALVVTLVAFSGSLWVSGTLLLPMWIKSEADRWVIAAGLGVAVAALAALWGVSFAQREEPAEHVAPSGTACGPAQADPAVMGGTLRQHPQPPINQEITASGSQSVALGVIGGNIFNRGPVSGASTPDGPRSGWPGPADGGARDGERTTENAETEAGEQS